MGWQGTVVAVSAPLAVYMGYKFNTGEWTAPAVEALVYLLALITVLLLLIMAEDQDQQGKRK